MFILTTLNGRTITVKDMHGWAPQTLANGQKVYVKIVNNKLEAITKEAYETATKLDVNYGEIELRIAASTTDTQRMFEHMHQSDDVPSLKHIAAEKLQQKFFNAWPDLTSYHQAAKQAVSSPKDTLRSKAKTLSDGAKRLSKKNK